MPTLSQLVKKEDKLLKRVENHQHYKETHKEEEYV